MKNHDQLKAEYLEAANQRWDAAVQRIRDLLRFSCSNPQFDDHLTRELVRALLMMPSQARWNVFGSERPELMGYYVSYEPIDIMEEMAQFVSYEIIDDGEPGVAYWRFGDHEVGEDMMVQCGPDHPDARPYFHRNIDVLREQYPDAEWLSIDRALEIVQQETRRQLDHEEEMKRMFPDDGSEWGKQRERMIRLVLDLVMSLDEEDNDDSNGTESQ